MPTKPSSRSRGLGRVLLYYVVLLGVLIISVRTFPIMADIVSGARLNELEGNLAGAFSGTPPVGTPVASGDMWGPWTGAIIAGLSMVGALVIMVPVTWVYMITRRQRGYEESVVHTLLILPIAVTGIVMIVQNSIALAFSLAGIVAAVRFRTTLDDTKDAVYVFLAIGVGLATGVQALGIALTLSLVFNLVVLLLWRTQFGNIYADQSNRASALSVGDVLAGPASAQSAMRVGDPAVLEALPETELSEIAERAVRIERHVSEERARKKGERANTMLLVHGVTAAPVQALLDPMLDEMAVRWKLAEIDTTEAGVMLVYLARMDGEAAQGELMDRVRGAPEVSAVELRSLKGLKPRA